VVLAVAADDDDEDPAVAAAAAPEAAVPAAAAAEAEVAVFEGPDHLQDRWLSEKVNYVVPDGVRLQLVAAGGVPQAEGAHQGPLHTISKARWDQLVLLQEQQQQQQQQQWGPFTVSQSLVDSVKDAVEPELQAWLEVARPLQPGQKRSPLAKRQSQRTAAWGYRARVQLAGQLQYVPMVHTRAARNESQNHPADKPLVTAVLMADYKLGAENIVNLDVPWSFTALTAEGLKVPRLQLSEVHQLAFRVDLGNAPQCG
jgi:hypothetical protein